MSRRSGLERIEERGGLVPISLGQVFVMCSGAVGMLFVGYELIEHFWLTALNPTVSHRLHLLLGVVAAAVAATLGTYVLLCQVDACDPGIIPSRRMRGVAARIQGVSLRTKLIVPIVLLAVLPGVGIGVLTIGQFDRELTEVTRRSLEGAAERMVLALGGFLEAGLADVRAVAATPAIVEVVGSNAPGGGGLRQAERAIETFFVAHAGYARVRVFALDGQEVLRVDRGSGVSATANGEVAAPAWSVLTRDRAGSVEGNVGFVTTRVGDAAASSEPPRGSLHYVWPLTEGDAVVGSVVLDSPSSVLTPFLGVFAEGGAATIYDASGAILVSAHTGAAPDLAVPPESQLVFTSPLLDDGMEGTLSVAVPRIPPSGLVSQLGAFIGLVLFLVLAVAVITGVLVAHYVTRPLKRLRTATMAIASGDLERRVEVTTGDEIEGLASDFNHMAERLSAASHRLSHWNEELLEEVDKQTSELSQLQAGFAKTDRLSCMGQMAASVMHEVGNPLAAIKTKIQVAEERGDMEEPCLGVLDDIVHEIDRLTAVLRSFSRVSRLRQPEFKPVALSDVVSGVASLVGPQIRKKKVDLQIVVDDELDLIRADADQIRQLIINLVLNAADAVPSGGVIRIQARRESANKSEAGRVSLEVVDDGMGIPESQLDQVWDAFYTTKEDGTGLGLAVSRQIVEEHGGVLTIESREGEGTTVKATFPPINDHRDEMTTAHGPGE